jgi:hypothetical protein
MKLPEAGGRTMASRLFFCQNDPAFGRGGGRHIHGR